MLGCQPTTEQDKSDSESTTTVEDDVAGLDSETSPMSETTKAQVANYEAEFVNRMLDLQQSQLTEYEALQAADAAGENGTSSLVDDEVSDTTNNETATNNAANGETPSPDTQATDSQTTDSQASDPETNAQQTSVPEINFPELPLINLAMKPPKELTAIEISNRYNVALQSLYLADEVPLPPQAVNTLLNIATLTPQVFNDPELAEHLVQKSPALARLLKQYQTWEQQQTLHNQEFEVLKQAQLEDQQQHKVELEKLSKELDAKIKDYDQLIEQYEKKLKQFEELEN